MSGPLRNSASYLERGGKKGTAIPLIQICSLGKIPEVKGQIKQLKAFSIDFLVMEGKKRVCSPPKHAIKARRV